MRKCKICGKELLKRQLKFCSKKCLGISMKGLNNVSHRLNVRKIISMKAKKRIKVQGHPRGMLGKKHSKETRKKLKEKRKGRRPSWKGGKFTDSLHGYVYLFKPKHPYCNNNGYVKEHRFVMEQTIKRFLRKEEVIHHKNGIRHDNRIENLLLFNNNSQHSRLHATKHHFHYIKMKKLCNFCNKIFYTYIKKQKYCSRKCYIKYYTLMR